MTLFSLKRFMIFLKRMQKN